MAAQVDIQSGDAGELGELFTLAKASFGGEPGWDDARAVSALERDTLFVARVGESVAGYVALRSLGEATRIDQLFVAPHHEGQGVGHRLLAHAEGYAISTGAGALEIVVEDDNDRAADFYRRSGFTRAGGQLYTLRLPASG
jgi:ribosomal protein S18 acetylase RimI-like enzyme